MSDVIVTIFDQASLEKHVAASLAQVPDGRHGALVGYHLLDGRWRVTIVHRIGGKWDLGATLGKDAAAGKIDGGISVKASW